MENHMPRPALRIFSFLCLLPLLLAAGCFDLELELSLNKDGSGIVSSAVIAPKQLASGNITPQKTLILEPTPQNSLQPRGEQVAFVSQASFKSLAQVITRKGLEFELRQVDKGFLWGLFASTYRLRAQVDGASQSKAQEAAPLLVGHFFKAVLEVPGEIKTAHAASLGGLSIQPQISDDKRKATWQVPLDSFLGHKGPLVFAVDFKADLDLPPDERKSVQSRVEGAS
jgi:hypothetical protein